MIKGEVVVTKNEAGQIVCVSRQDEDGRILSIIAESKKIEPPTVLVFLEGGMVSGALCDAPVTIKVIDYDTEDSGLEDDELTWVPQLEFLPSEPAIVGDWTCTPDRERVRNIVRAIDEI